MSRVTHFFSSGSCIALISLLMLLILPQPEAQGQPPSQTSSITQASAPALSTDTQTAGHPKTGDQASSKVPSSEELTLRSTHASERSASANWWSTWIAGGSLLVSLVAAGATVLGLLPTLKSIQVQSTLNGISLIKQRLDVLTNGKWNLSQESLYVPEHETPEEQDKRIHSMVDQLCDGSENDRKREAVERHIRQWLELEARLDKQLNIQK